MFYSKSLKKFKGIKHCFFSRKGGFSSGLYKSLNCGKGSKDKRKNITKNLKYVSQKIDERHITVTRLNENIKIRMTKNPKKMRATVTRFNENMKIC